MIFNRVLLRSLGCCPFVKSCFGSPGFHISQKGERLCQFLRDATDGSATHVSVMLWAGFRAGSHDGMRIVNAFSVSEAFPCGAIFAF